MNKVTVTYNYRYLVLGILLVIPVLGSLLEIFDSSTELGTVHLYSVLWLLIVGLTVYFAFTNVVSEDIKYLHVKNGLKRKSVEWKDISDIIDIKEPRLEHGNIIFTKYRKYLLIEYQQNRRLKIPYFYDEDVEEIKELIRRKLKLEIERHSYKADLLHKVLDIIDH